MMSFKRQTLVLAELVNGEIEITVDLHRLEERIPIDFPSMLNILTRTIPSQDEKKGEKKRKRTCKDQKVDSVFFNFRCDSTSRVIIDR